MSHLIDVLQHPSQLVTICWGRLALLLPFLIPRLFGSNLIFLKMLLLLLFKHTYFGCKLSFVMQYVPFDRFISTSFSISHQWLRPETRAHWILQKTPRNFNTEFCLCSFIRNFGSLMVVAKVSLCIIHHIVQLDFFFWFCFVFCLGNKRNGENP